MANIVEEQLKEIAELHEKNKELYKQIGALQEALADVEKQLECWEDKHNTLSVELENCKTVQLYEQKVQNSKIKNLERELALYAENEQKLKIRYVLWRILCRGG